MKIDRERVANIHAYWPCIAWELPWIEAEVSLVGEVVGVKDDFDEVGLRDEGLWLLNFTAEQARLLAVGHIRLCIAVHDLP